MSPTLKAASRLLLAAAFVTGAATAADDTAIPASSGLAADLIVNGQPISRNHVTLMTTSFGDKSARSLSGSDARAAARTELITEEVLAQQARKEGLDKKPAVSDQLAFQTREILSRAYLEDYFDKNPVTDEGLKSAYEWNRANGKIVEYHVRQILVPTSEQAQQLLERLNKGEDFAALAKQYSQDPGGQNTGGDIGWFRPDIFVDHNFCDAVTGLKKGEYTKAPVRTRFGWHLIKIEEGPRPVANPEPFEALGDSAKQALRQKAAQIKIENLTERLTAAARISGPGATAH